MPIALAGALPAEANGVANDGPAVPLVEETAHLVDDLPMELALALHQALQAVGNFGTVGALRVDQGDAWRLFNLAPLLPEGQRASRIFRGRGELIDHIFCSRALLQTVTAVATVAPGPLPSITEVASVRRNKPMSDHAMVVADLDLT